MTEVTLSAIESVCVVWVLHDHTLEWILTRELICSLIQCLQRVVQCTLVLIHTQTWQYLDVVLEFCLHAVMTRQATTHDHVSSLVWCIKPTGCSWMTELRYVCIGYHVRYIKQRTLACIVTSSHVLDVEYLAVGEQLTQFVIYIAKLVAEVSLIYLLMPVECGAVCKNHTVTIQLSFLKPFTPKVIECPLRALDWTLGFTRTNVFHFDVHLAHQSHSALPLSNTASPKIGVPASCDASGFCTGLAWNNASSWHSSCLSPTITISTNPPTMP